MAFEGIHPKLTTLQYHTLISINLSHSNLTCIPDTLTTASPQISILNLSFNQLDYIDLHSTLPHVTQLNLVCNSLKSIDNIPTIFPHLHDLKVSGNQLQEIPKTISNLRKLRVFEVGSECYGGNQITSVPLDLGSCPQLLDLDFSHNRISTLPPAFFTLATSLKKLSLYHNQLNSIPSTISSLRQLETLVLASNQLTELPDSITTLHNLMFLDISRNNLLYFTDKQLRYFKRRSVLLSANPFSLTHSAIMSSKWPRWSGGNVSTLLEMCSRVIIKHAISIPDDVDWFPDHLRQYLCSSSGGQCSMCKKEFVNEFHVEVSLDDRLGIPDIPCAYTLCSYQCIKNCRIRNNRTLEW